MLYRHCCCRPYNERLNQIAHDLVERAARQDLIATTDADRRKETHHQDRVGGTKFVPFALETYGALCDWSDRCLVECATLASRECARLGPLLPCCAHGSVVVLYYIVYGSYV